MMHIMKCRKEVLLVLKPKEGWLVVCVYVCGWVGVRGLKNNSLLQDVSNGAIFLFSLSLILPFLSTIIFTLLFDNYPIITGEF